LDEIEMDWLGGGKFVRCLANLNEHTKQGKVWIFTWHEEGGGGKGE
jgi:hypothetical protein